MFKIASKPSRAMPWRPWRAAARRPDADQPQNFRFPPHITIVISASTASTCNPAIPNIHRRYDIRERPGRHSSQQALHISHTIVLSRIKNHDEIGQCSVRDCQGPSRLCRLHVRMLHLPAHCHSLCARSITPGHLFGTIQRPGRR